ncbi:MAG: amino acid ABC transporter permease [Clostridia bacterium]|jgi:putative glutamine transport system permease protein|nr:amino acid ABC transporter permease [Oscillospiraceae bacterium]MBO7422582.1 amino acid ABC transporter permease [Oscillospiraceae bacterium]MBP5725547.1 amino acid ABC transporter permease [Clostridia bacterium]
METIFDARSWSLVWQHRGTFVNGFLNTLESAAVGLLIALAIGIVLGLAGISEKKPLKILSRVYVEFFQNTPLILQVCFLYYALVYAGIKIPVVSVGFIALGIYTGAYMAEVIRAGILSIPAGQFDAAISQGFSWVDMMRIIILPQTIKIILPPMVNQMVNLIKNTSCLYIIGGADLIATTYNFVTGETTGGAYGPAYLVGAALFFCICFPLAMLAGKWEESLKKREQQTGGKEAA